jgi:sec-independent protein translocase protein TatA
MPGSGTESERSFMGSFSIWHWIVVLLVILIIFGAGKLPNVMGDIAKGIKSFKRNMRDDEEEAPKPVASDRHKDSQKAPPHKDPI